jgi:hypothetical protein
MWAVRAVLQRHRYPDGDEEQHRQQAIDGARSGNDRQEGAR